MSQATENWANALARLLAAAAGCWIMLLILVALPWSSLHMLAWSSLALVGGSGTICLLVSAVALMFQREVPTAVTLYGVCVIACLGILSLVSQGAYSSASFLFVLLFFVLTITVPLAIAAERIHKLGWLRLLTKSKS
jgi:hypothetical protein